MRYSIAICTRNRSALLAGALESMVALHLPGAVEWEFLVIDNGCSDDTPAVVSSFEGRLPLRRCVEPVAGLSHARNRALVEAKGEWIVWTDDDVLVDPLWLVSYEQSLGRHPEAAVLGGPIDPLFLQPSPTWLRRGWRSVGTAFALRDLGSEEIALTEEHCPFGANYAVRADVQKAHPYDPALGRAPGRMTGGEEVQVIRTILRGSAAGWWVPGARVRHVIPRERQSLHYLRQFFLAQGDVISSRLLGGSGSQPPRMIFGRPAWWLWHWMVLEGRYRVLRLTAAPEVWLPALARSSVVWGQLRSFPTARSGAAAGP